MSPDFSVYGKERGRNIRIVKKKKTKKKNNNLYKVNRDNLDSREIQTSKMCVQDLNDSV